MGLLETKGRRELRAQASTDQILHAEGRDGDGEQHPALFDDCIHSERE